MSPSPDEVIARSRDAVEADRRRIQDRTGFILALAEIAIPAVLRGSAEQNGSCRDACQKMAPIFDHMKQRGILKV